MASSSHGRFVIQALAREGFQGSWRAGRFWPSSAATEIEVVGEDEDPPPGEKDEVLRVGRKSFDLLKEDKHLRVAPAGDPLALARASTDVQQLQKEVERLTLENQRLQDELAHAQGTGKHKRKSE